MQAGVHLHAAVGAPGARHVLEGVEGRLGEALHEVRGLVELGVLAGLAHGVVALHGGGQVGEAELLGDLVDGVGLDAPALLDGLLQVLLGVGGAGVVVAGLLAAHPLGGLAQVGVDALVLAGLVVGVVHHDPGLAGAHQGLAALGQREGRDVALVHEAAAGAVHVQAAEEPVAVVLVDVEPLSGEGPAFRGGRHGAALVAQHGEGAVERAAGVEHHLDARAVGHGVAQRVDGGVEVLLLHLGVAQKAAGADDGGASLVVHDLAVNLGLHAAGLAVLHEHGVHVGAVGDGAAVLLDVGDDGVGAARAVGVDVVAAAEAHAVGVAPQVHGDAQVAHAVDGGAGASQDVLEQLGVDAAVGEAVHVLEHVVQAHPGVLVFLDLGLAGVGAAALGPVGHHGRDALLQQAHLEALLGQVVGGHEASDAGACDHDVALDGLVSGLLGGLGRGAVAVVGLGRGGLVGTGEVGACEGCGTGGQGGGAGYERAAVE